MENAEAEGGKEMNYPCKWLEEMIRGMLKCLGLHTADYHPSPSSPSSSSSSSSADEKDGADDPLHPPTDDPPTSTNDPPKSLLLLGSGPPRKGVGRGGNPQTNDASS
ncbi:unnamed protein product [Cuscuta europaea]|uniref:Uncharacterized protein n=1 Tax=Cuscuta europaea TaxID=41803 RepID=A0A9P0ZK36_CUSEU|nr:unnamed protein product [Cuscuta europaea]